MKRIKHRYATSVDQVERRTWLMMSAVLCRYSYTASSDDVFIVHVNIDCK
jgi:hypothetical protein